MIPLTLDEIVRVIGGRSERPVQPFSITGVSTDSRSCTDGDLFVAIRGDRFDGHEYVQNAMQNGAIATIVDREMDASHRLVIRVEDCVEALGKLAAFHRNQTSFTVIAVTGSNGKTTTKGMIGHVLGRHLLGRSAEKSYNNHIGVPLTLLSTRLGDEFLVVEIGTNAVGEVRSLSLLATPNICIITSVSEAHLAGFGSVEAVATEKASLLDGLRPGGLAIVNADSPELMHRVLQREEPCAMVTFGFSQHADVRVTECVATLEGVTYTLNDKFSGRLRLLGRHNALNAAATFAACRRLNVEPEAILHALEDFQPPPMRLNVSRCGDLTLVDDSYNANPSSMAAAIGVISRNAGADKGVGRRVFIVGDMLELGDEAVSHHERTGRLLREAGADLVIAVGTHAGDVARGVRDGCNLGDGVETHAVDDAEEVCRSLRDWLCPNDLVLVKGSRRIALDRVTRRIQEVFGEAVDDGKAVETKSTTDGTSGLQNS